MRMLITAIKIKLKDFGENLATKANPKANQLAQKCGGMQWVHQVDRQANLEEAHEGWRVIWRRSIEDGEAGNSPTGATAIFNVYPGILKWLYSFDYKSWWGY